MEVCSPHPNTPPLRTDSGGQTHLEPTDSRCSELLNREQNVSFLLKELDSLRDTNNKLQLQLVQKQKQLEEHQLDMKHKDPEDRHTAVLQELFDAQRDRDQALMARLHLANEERDEALLRTKRLQQAASELDNINPEINMDLGQVLDSLAAADSTQSVQQGGAVLLALIQKAQHRRRDITAQEMKVLLAERDQAVVKLKHLEQLVKENKMSTHTYCKDQQEKLEKEKDQVMMLNQTLEEELQQLRANHREAGSALGTDAGQDPLLFQLQQISRQQQETQQQLQRSLEAERQAHAKIHRLERLVEVLRKKVGTGSLRSVT